MTTTETQKKSKGPGPIRDSLDDTRHRLYCMAEHCRYAHHARECLQAARGEISDIAVKLRSLARHWGREARAMYAAAMESGVAA